MSTENTEPTSMICYGCILLDDDWRGSVPFRIQACLIPIADKLKDLEFSLVKPALSTKRYTLNIYGPEDLQDIVARQLGDKRAYLQKPYCIRPGVRYINPQLINFGNRRLEYIVEEKGEEVYTWKRGEVSKLGFEPKLQEEAANGVAEVNL